MRSRRAASRWCCITIGSWQPARDANGKVKTWTRAARWIMDHTVRGYVTDAPPAKRVVAYLDAFRAVGGAVTFNLLIYQDGSIFEPDLAVMAEVRRQRRAT